MRWSRSLGTAREVFNTLAKKRFKPNPLKKDDALDAARYKRCLDHFRNDVHWGRILYPYDVNRYHILAADKIIPVEQNLPSQEGRNDRLSTFDILIIAMACELSYVGQRDETFLVTCDERMSRVCGKLQNSDISDLIIPGPLGEPEKKRWTPPTCLYLPRLKRGELRSVPNQSSYNY